MAGVFALALLGVGLSILQPMLSQRMIDHAVQAVLSKESTLAEGIAQINLYGGIMLAVILTGTGLDTFRNFRTAMLNAKVVFRLRQRLFDHLLHLSLGDLSDMKSGGIVSRLSGDLDHASELVQTAVLSPAVSLVQAVVAFTILYVWNWQLAAAVTTILIPLLGAHIWYMRRIRPLFRSARQDRGVVDGRVTETFGGIRVVRAFRREPREESEYAVGHHTVIRKEMYGRLLQMVSSSGWGIMTPTIALINIWYGGHLVMQGKATVGQLFAFQWYIQLVLGPILHLASTFTSTQRSLAAMERVFDVLDKPADKPDVPDAVECPPQVREFHFDHVSFGYRSDVPVIQDFDLKVKGGSVVALVGPSGAGKTTVTDLVARFYDPTAGIIRLNGIDLRQIRLASFRRLLGVVQQEVFLFDGSIRDNIAYGRRHATDDQIIAAAERANAHGFIMDTPEGYDTLIGERGVKLSGGQRQRLSIARAILADPQILILDEATSNLDTESEQLIQQALDQLYANRTTFVIAHRLSTVTHADLIVVMQDGTIVETGKHDDLMAKGGLYYDMVERQRQFLAEKGK